MTKSPPAGARPPSGIGLLAILRLLWLLATLLWFSADRLPAWLGLSAQAATSVRAARLVSTLDRALHSPLLWHLVRVGAVVLAVELFLAAVTLVWHSCRGGQTEGIYLRIRAARTPRSRGTTSAKPPTGEDWFRAVHGLFGRDHTGMLTCLVTGRLDTPAELGVQVAGGTNEGRATWVQALTKIITGHLPDSLVDERPDPLETALTPGAWVAWEELGLARGPEHPLRFASTAEQADLLGPLIQAVSPPKGVARIQVQVILRPRKDWSLKEGWRAIGLRRLLQLKAKADYSVGDEIRTLEQKLDSPVYDTTLKIVAVSERPELHSVLEVGDQVALEARAVVQAGDRAELAAAAVDQVVAVLSQYTARSGHGVQGLRRRGRGSFQLPSEPPSDAIPLPVWVAFGLSVLAFLPSLSGGLTLPVQLLPPEVVQALPSLTFPLQVVEKLPGVLAALLPLAMLLFAALLLRRTRGEHQQQAVAHIKGHQPRVAPSWAVLWPAPLWPAPAILSPDELRGLWHLPTPGLSGMVLTLPNLYLPPPEIAFIPPDATDRVPLGIARHSDGTPGVVGPRLFDLNQVFHMTGGMGSGKSQMFSNVMQWLLEHGHGYTYFEGKPGDTGNLLQFARTLLSLKDEGRLVIIDPLDVGWPVGINPLARIDLSRPDAADQALGALDSMLARLDPETWSRAPGMRQYLQMGTLLVVLAEPWPTVGHVKQCLIDEGYRTRLLERCTNIEVKTFWEVTFPNTASSQKTSLDALLRRFDQLLVPEMSRHMITTSTFRFDQAMAEQWIVMICVPTDRLGNLARALAMLLFQAFVRGAFERPGTALSRIPYPLILDEFQELVENAATDDVKDALAKLRSQGTPSHYAHQELPQLGELQSLMLTNAQNRVIPRILGNDAGVYAKLFEASGITAADISSQEPDHRYADFLVNRRPTGLFSMEPLPWPKELKLDVPPAPPLPWQTVLPKDADPIDGEVARLVYGELPSPGAAVAVLARTDQASWEHILARWEVLRKTHRERILAEPGLIPDRMERQRWLSRLLAAQPWILAAAAYQRQRWEVAPGEEQTRVSPPPRGKRSAESAGVTRQDLPPGVLLPVSGATLAPEEQPPALVVETDRPDAEEVRRKRGKRRSQAEVVGGYSNFGGTEEDDQHSD